MTGCLHSACLTTRDPPTRTFTQRLGQTILVPFGHVEVRVGKAAKCGIGATARHVWFKDSNGFGGCRAGSKWLGHGQSHWFPDLLSRQMIVHFGGA